MLHFNLIIMQKQIVKFTVVRWLDRYIKRNYPEVADKFKSRWGHTCFVHWADFAVFEDGEVYLAANYTQEFEWLFTREERLNLFGPNGEGYEASNWSNTFYYRFKGDSVKRIVKSCNNGNYRLV